MAKHGKHGKVKTVRGVKEPKSAGMVALVRKPQGREMQRQAPHEQPSDSANFSAAFGANVPRPSPMRKGAPLS